MTKEELEQLVVECDEAQARAQALQRQRDNAVRASKLDASELADTLGVTSYRVRQILARETPETKLVVDLEPGDLVPRLGGGPLLTVKETHEVDPFVGYVKVTYTTGGHTFYPGEYEVEVR